MGTQYLDWHIEDKPETLATALPADLEWTPAPSMGPGAETVVIEGNPQANAPFTFRLKFPPHFRVPVHRHPVAERITVLAGTLYVGVGPAFDPVIARRYPAGGFVIVPAGMPMFSYTDDEEAIVQIHGVGPWEVHYVNPAEDPLRR